MSDSNITSFDHRRKTLGQLQRTVEQQHKDIQTLQEKSAWQEMYIETLEVSFSEFKEEHEFMVDNLLKGLRNLNTMVMMLGSPRS